MTNSQNKTAGQILKGKTISTFIAVANKFCRQKGIALSVRLFTSPGHNFLTSCLILIRFYTIVLDPRVCYDQGKSPCCCHSSCDVGSG